MSYFDKNEMMFALGKDNYELISKQTFPDAMFYYSIEPMVTGFDKPLAKDPFYLYMSGALKEFATNLYDAADEQLEILGKAEKRADRALFDLDDDAVAMPSAYNFMSMGDFADAAQIATGINLAKKGINKFFVPTLRAPRPIFKHPQLSLEISPDSTMAEVDELYDYLGNFQYDCDLDRRSYILNSRELDTMEKYDEIKNGVPRICDKIIKTKMTADSNLFVVLLANIWANRAWVQQRFETEAIDNFTDILHPQIAKQYDDLEWFVEECAKGRGLPDDQFPWLKLIETTTNMSMMIPYVLGQDRPKTLAPDAFKIKINGDKTNKYDFLSAAGLGYMNSVNSLGIERTGPLVAAAKNYQAEADELKRIIDATQSINELSKDINAADYVIQKAKKYAKTSQFKKLDRMLAAKTLQKRREIHTR